MPAITNNQNFVVKNGIVVGANVLVANYNSSNVGINTGSPDAALTVNGTANVSGNAILGQNITVAGNGLFGNVTVGAGATNVILNTTSITLGAGFSVVNTTVQAVGNGTSNVMVNSTAISVGNAATNAERCLDCSIMPPTFPTSAESRPAFRRCLRNHKTRLVGIR